MGQKFTDLVEAVVCFYLPDQGGRKVPLRYRWFLYNLSLKLFKQPNDHLFVNIIDGPSEIKPGDEVSIVMSVISIGQFFPLDDSIAGDEFYLCEVMNPIGKGKIVRKWLENSNKLTNQIENYWGPTPEQVKVWGYDEHAWLVDQDEDLIFLEPEYIPVLIELISDESCPKKDIALEYLIHCTRHLVAKAKHREDKTIVALEEMATLAYKSNNKGLREWADHVFLRLEEF